MSTKTKKVVVIKKATKTAPKPRKGSKVPTGKLVNVKVAGERAMRKGVILVPAPEKGSGVFAVRTGRRGRPAFLTASQIERTRVL